MNPSMEKRERGHIIIILVFVHFTESIILIVNPKSVPQIPKKTKASHSHCVILISIGDQAMESEHCLSHRKHPSILSITLIIYLLFLSFPTLI